MKSALLRPAGVQGTPSAPQKRTIADYLLDHPESAIGVRGPRAGGADPSPPPPRIIRIGAGGSALTAIRDFRRAVTYEAVPAPARNEEERKEITFSDSMEEIKLRRSREEHRAPHSRHPEPAGPKSLERCVEISAAAGTCCCSGWGPPCSAARDLYLKFLRLNKACVINEDWHFQLLTARNGHRRGRGAGGSPTPGRRRRCSRVCRPSRRTATPVIANHRFSASPVAELADHNIYIAAKRVHLPVRAMSSPACPSSTWWDILTTAFANRDYGGEPVPAVPDPHL